MVIVSHKKILEESPIWNSFIDVSDFNSLEECVKYVINLDIEKIHWMMEQPIYNEDVINL